MANPAKDMTGMVFGRLTVIERAPNSPKGHVYWRCLCSCGASHVAAGGNLRQGTIRSCGCFLKDRNSASMNKRWQNGEIEPNPGTHLNARKGQHTGAYTSWCAMKKRCNNPNSHNYAYYGGRGITYDPRWESFENFLADMGDRPSHLSLDRIDPDGNYGPGLCRWATRMEQTHNRRNSKNRVG